MGGFEGGVGEGGGRGGGGGRGVGTSSFMAVGERALGR